MLKRRQLIAAAGVTVAAAHLPNAQAQTVTSLRITHVLSPNEPANEACLLLAARITDRSQGKSRSRFSRKVSSGATRSSMN